MRTTRPGRLILLCGLPGAGKTTLARRLAGELPAIRLCPDEWLADLGIDAYDEQARDRLERLFRRHAHDLLRLGQTVILEFGFWSRAEREELRLAARALGAAVELRYLAAPLEELHSRLEGRNATGGRGTVPISRDMLDHWATLFEPPTPDEMALFDEPATSPREDTAG
ncbi:AAA family ATPase [Nonomuraea basaltis]|uniref:AAA family ATPase n=1 Tax=Nonomuraea basaltis TaxID=2495887 RepID=UPI00110C4850|nr:ATP-binding protein [Nonomuraea basaltis]TMR88936.1 ATP-binding protein [Nonomuraea basaltis]